MRINIEDLDITDDALTYLYEGKPFTGVAYELYPDGRLWSEQIYNDGMLEVPSKLWFPSGQLEKEVQPARGDYVLIRIWYESGQLKSEECIEHGILVHSQEWGEAGELIKEFHIKESDSTFSILEIRRRNAARLRHSKKPIAKTE